MLAATASATARVPAAKRGSSNTPMGPFHNTVRASVIGVGELGRRPRPDVEADPSVGDVLADLADLTGRLHARRRRCHRG